MTHRGCAEPRASGRGRAAAARLGAAHRRFERSMAALRKAALDHVDRHCDASLRLRAALDRGGPLAATAEPGGVSPVSHA